jgi:hypothetical protein
MDKLSCVAAQPENEPGAPQTVHGTPVFDSVIGNVHRNNGNVLYDEK